MKFSYIYINYKSKFQGLLRQVRIAVGSDLSTKCNDVSEEFDPNLAQLIRKPEGKSGVLMSKYVKFS